MANNKKHRLLSDQEAPKKVQEGFLGQRMIVLPPNIISRIASNPLIQHLYVSAIGFYPHAMHHYRERKKGSPHYILLYCVEGSGLVYLEGKKHQLLPNNYLIIPKEMPHHYQSSETAPWSIYWAHFTGDIADLLYSRHLAGTEPEAKPVPYDDILISQFKEILTTLETSFYERELEISNLNFLHFLSTLIYQQGLLSASGPTDVISKSIACMKANLNRNFTVQELASAQSLSVSHFSDLFRKKTGHTPIHYFNQLKMQQSCQYLFFTDRSIKEICNELGFEDPYYFSRLFKKLMGLPPSRYRNIYKRQ